MTLLKELESSPLRRTAFLSEAVWARTWVEAYLELVILTQREKYDKYVDVDSDATISDLRTRLAPLKVELRGAEYLFSSTFRDGSSVSRVERFARPVEIFISNLPTQKEFQHNGVTYTDEGSYFLVGNMTNKDTETDSWAFKYNVRTRQPRVHLYEDSGGNAMVQRLSDR